jgi:hypothetical protein
VIAMILKGLMSACTVVLDDELDIDVLDGYAKAMH